MVILQTHTLSDWKPKQAKSETLVSQLENDKFDKDDMLQEGLLEAVDKHAVYVRVVDQTSRSYNETVVEDGLLYLQTTPNDFGVNISQVASDLINIL
ncbi:hypothetical protein F66182_7167 [Fusarium sp. NRRL 66182]|nr:hypothetical protein F66182_7167 [Fusarium sp. NRRL 66182]